MVLRSVVPFLLACALLTCVVMPSPAEAWTHHTVHVLGEEAARLVPPDLYRQLVRHRRAYGQGLVEPFDTAPPHDRYVYPNGSGRLDEVIGIAVTNAIDTIRGHRSMQELAYRMGVVAHFVALANNPVHADFSAGERRWGTDYLRYLDSVEPRIQIVFYGFHGVDRSLDLDRWLSTTLNRSRRLHPMLDREYQRIGFGSGVQGFDDRSTAYAVAALGYSHAVSDIAEVLRYIWIEAGGIDSRTDVPRRGERIVRIPRVDPARDGEPRGRTSADTMRGRF
ncbi:MAG: hypothetical protein AAGE94_09625 [Acidobacteriota bacterium]